MNEWYVTETPDDPSLNTHWIGEATDAMDALDKFAVDAGFVPYSELIKDPNHAGMVGDKVTWPEPLELPEGAMWATFTNTTVYAIPMPKEEEMKTYDTVRPFTIAQLDATIAKIERSIRNWEEGRMTSPDERDHVIDACTILGIDWHQIDRDTDNPVVEKIANEIFEDAGETITDVRDLATHILMRLYEEGVVGENKRTILVHINVEVPAALAKGRADLAEDIADEILGALSVGVDPDEVPRLAGSKYTVALAEEV